MQLTAGQISELVGGRIIGDESVSICDVCAVERAGNDHLTFAGDKHKLRVLVQREPTCAITTEELAATLPDNLATTVIVVDDPLQSILAVLRILRPPRKPEEFGISPHAFVSESARIGAGSTIHPCAHVRADVVIGSECTIHPGVVIGNGCRLGDNVTLYPYVVLYPDVIIGNNVVIHAGSVLGSDGFGYRLRDGRHERLPHYGTVCVHDDVEIAVGCSVDRALIGETSIGQGTKIDNLVVVAHNCELGKHNLLVAQVGFAGSVTTGDYSVCAGQVGVADHVHLGERSVLGAKAGVHRDVPDGETHIGSPATPVEQARRNYAALRKLPELRQTLRALEKRMAHLTEQISVISQSASRTPTDASARDAA